MDHRGTIQRRGAVFAVAAVAILAICFSATAAFGAVSFQNAVFSGYATGTVLHADALQAGGTRLADVEEAFTGSAVNTAGLAAIHNEMSRVVIPAGGGKNSYGRGSGLEVGLAHGPDEENQILLAAKASAIAPPSTDVVTKEIAVPGDPLVYASALRGQAQALWADDQCILGQDISFGRGHAADVQLVNQGATNSDGSFKVPLVGTDAPSEERQVASSYSHEFLDIQRNKAGKPIGLAYGLVSEARMSIAPITLFRGTPQEFTIEVGGEWVLRASAGGIKDSAHIFYGPGDVDLSTPILRIIQNNKVTGEIDFQNLLQKQGLVVTVPNIAEVAIGEDPRAIGGSDTSSPAVDTANGLSASAAVDVVRVKLLNADAATHVADIRVGHMEVKTAVPAGGINCGIPVTKTASPRGVTVGQNFIVTIKVDNPFGCDLTHVKLTDVITTSGSATFAVVDTNPNASSVPSGSNLDHGTIVWNDIGPIATGKSKSVTATFTAQGSGGIIHDIADVLAVLANCEGSEEGNELVGGSLPLHVPVVLHLTGGGGNGLPPTGVGTSTAAVIGALALLCLAGVTIRQLRRTSI